MDTDPEEIRERAWIERRGSGDGAAWIAEDPVTECAGTGDVEIEAVGNLVSAVAEYERSTGERPLMKAPGRTVARAAPPTESRSLLGRLRSLLRSTDAD